MRYEEYKDSGIEWLGEVPSHWTVCKVKHKYSFKTGATPSSGKKEFYDGEIKWANISDINGGIIHDTVKHITDEAVRSCSMTISPKGSLLYSFKLSVGQVAFCGDDMYTNEAIATFESNTQNLRYLYYIAPQFIIHNANRNIYNAPLLNQDLIKNALIVLPPIEEQLAIASYLDEKCGKINGAIDVQKKKIDLLNELKQTIITNAVTKGLNPDAPMKDSGVEWIGEIPEHWKIKRTRFLCNIQTGDKDTVNREDDGLYPFYVRSPKVERINTYSFDGEAVLMAGDGVGAGKVFHYANGKFDYHQRVYNLHNFKDVSGLFFYYYILNKFRYIIEEGAAKNTVDSVRLNMIQDFWMTIPPISEQQNIVKYIDGEVSKIDAQIAKANRRIELLNELKQSVITEAVTGKIKVC